jgi:hypothetical protein
MRKNYADGRLTLDGGDGEYLVSLDGSFVGTLQYQEKRYNLRRVTVTRYWRMHLSLNASGTALDRMNGDWPTATEAMLALEHRVLMAAG